MQSFNEWRNEQRLKINGYTERDAYNAGAQSRQAEIDELQKRIDKMDVLIVNFINDLKETSIEDSESIHDYWRGFSSCAESANSILIRRYKALKGETNE